MWYKNSSEFKSENGHEINSTWYPRVTRIVSIKAKPALENFLREVGNYENAETIKQKSAKEGTILHESVQGLLLGRLTEVPEEVEPAIRAFETFNLEKKIELHPDFVERQIWSSRHRYAGTVDALAQINGKFGVLDIKTSTGIYPDYNLQTAAYVSALQEFEIKKALDLPREIETRWILRINQHRLCKNCAATLREKGGYSKIRNGKSNADTCTENEHDWGNLKGEVELREFPYLYRDTKAFMAAKILWEWENNYWLKQVGYLN